MKPAVLEVMRMNRVCRMVLVTSVGSFILVIFYFQSMLHPGRAPAPPQPHRDRTGTGRAEGSARLRASPAPRRRRWRAPRELSAAAAGPGSRLPAPLRQARGSAAGAAPCSPAGSPFPATARGSRGKVASLPAGNFPREGAKLFLFTVVIIFCIVSCVWWDGVGTSWRTRRDGERLRELPIPGGSFPA